MQPRKDDPVILQRMLVYAVTGMVCLIGILLVVAFKNPKYGRLPGPAPLISLGSSWVSMMLFYELRWYVRVWATLVVGLAQLAAGIAMLYLGMPKPLGVVNAILGIALSASAYGIHLERRGPWSFAVSCFGTLALTFFFGSSKIAAEMDVHLAWAALPALGLFLPACVMLGTSAPGTPRYQPWARFPTAPR
jgi:hypothetical protein